MPHTVSSLTHQRGLIFSMVSKQQLAKIEFVKVWVTRLPSLSLFQCGAIESPASRRKMRVLREAVPGLRWLTIIMRQVSYIQYHLACKTSQRSTSYNIVKSVLAWTRVFRRRHLGRRVTAVTCPRWPTMYYKSHQIANFKCFSSRLAVVFVQSIECRH